MQGLCAEEKTGVVAVMIKDLGEQGFVSRGNVHIRPTESGQNGHAFGHIRSVLITCLCNLSDPLSCEE